MFNELIFLSPWTLAALAALPLLWWLLRVMPPRAKTVIFSAFFFLKGLETPRKSAARTPWWLVLLRMLVVALFIIAFAEPVLHPAENLPGGKRGEVLMIVDNGWSAASGWKDRQDKIQEYLRRTERSGRSVIFLPTAPSAKDGHVHAHGPMPAGKAREWVNRLQPESWPADVSEASAEAGKIFSAHQVTHTVFFSDGLNTDDSLPGRAQTLVTDSDTNNPYILRQTSRHALQPSFSLERLHAAAQDTPLQLFAYSDSGDVIDNLKIVFPSGKTEYAFSWNMLPEVRNRAAKLALHAPQTAATVFMAGTQWRQHPAGIIAAADRKDDKDFLSEVYYLRRAIETGNQVTIDTLSSLLKLQLSVLILPDSTALTATEKSNLADWVEKGGFLIRFAGPNLAAQPDDPLLPVPLRQGQRAMSGAMTWEKPVHLGDIAQQSPLYGMAVPQDVTVTRQLLADPLPETFEKTWLQLEDGTPLVTGGRSGQGTLVLIHTSAGPDWSNFCYSGLYVEALRRMISLSNGISNYQAEAVLSPLLLMDGFGRLAAPHSLAMTASIGNAEDFIPSPATPPGIYGSSQEFQAFNLGDSLPKMQPLKNIPTDVTVEPYKTAVEDSLKQPLIETAVLLLLAETLITLGLRGILSAAALFLSVAFLATPAIAAEKDLVSGVHLGYIKTGDKAIDRTSFNGLSGLADEINKRTTIKVTGVDGLDPESPALAYYPFLYWPMTEYQTSLSADAAGNLQDYIADGGIIVFDTRDGQFGSSQNTSTPGVRQLRLLTQSMQIPELADIPADNILTRSFYLLERFPGRYDAAKIWVEKEPSPHHDSVTTIIIGANDWAAAWSKDAGDQARYMIEPGGEQQREMAYRFGINLAMAALAGSYKADQVHVPYILERLGR